MAGLWSSLTPLQVFFLVCGLVGSSFVIFRLILQFMGGDVEGDAGGDFDGGGDLDGDGGDVDGEHSDSDVHFKLLSIHGLSAFLMMFGFVALAIHRDTSAGVFLSIAGGTMAGLGAVWIIKKLYQFLYSLQSSGTMGIDQAVGSRGTVYVRITESGTGQVQISMNNRVREYDARSQDRRPLKAGTPIEVVEVSGTVLIVRPVD